MRVNLNDAARLFALAGVTAAVIGPLLGLIYDRVGRMPLFLFISSCVLVPASVLFNALQQQNGSDGSHGHASSLHRHSAESDDEYDEAQAQYTSALVAAAAQTAAAHAAAAIARQSSSHAHASAHAQHALLASVQQLAHAATQASGTDVTQR